MLALRHVRTETSGELFRSNVCEVAGARSRATATEFTATGQMNHGMQPRPVRGTEMHPE